MKTPEERAQISRENGAKSKGPITEEGKMRSSQNALKTGEYSTKLFPPDAAVVLNEDPAEYDALVDELRSIYRPVNTLAMAVVSDIATNRWQIIRLHRLIVAQWNMALIQESAKPTSHPTDVANLHYHVAVTNQLIGSTAIVARLNREIGRLQLAIARLERQVVFIHKNFNAVSPEQLKQQTELEVEIKPLSTDAAAEIQKNDPPVVITETTPDVIAACQLHFPGRPILILPPDHVALGLPEPDDFPDVPDLAA